MEELLLKGFSSIVTESTTFILNTGPDFGVSCLTCLYECCFRFTLGATLLPVYFKSALEIVNTNPTEKKEKFELFENFYFMLI